MIYHLYYKNSSDILIRIRQFFTLAPFALIGLKKMGGVIMFCLICGNRLPDDAMFCNACGRRVSNSSVESQESIHGRPTATSLNSAPVYPPTEYYSPTMPARPSSFTMPLAPVQSTTPLWSPTLPASPISSTVQPVQWPATPPVSLPPLNALQRFLVRVFQPAMASNALFGVVLGSILAVVGGALLSFLLLVVAHAIVPHGALYFSNSSQDSIGVALGIFPLHSNWRDSLQLFLVMHGVAQHTTFQSTAQNYSYTNSSTAPLSGLLVIPAVLLTLGGYIAACTDLQNRVQISLLRGAAIAIPYTALLLLVVTQVNGFVPQATETSTTTYTLSMDIPLVLVFGLLWGLLFGLLGASVKLSCGRWRQMIRQYLLHTRHPQVAGMIVGGLAAAGVGLGLALVFVYGFLAYSSYSTSVLATRLCFPGDWQYLLTWGLTQGPLHGANLYLFSFGSPITIINSGLQGNTCFYANSLHTVLDIRDSTLHFPPWVYAVLLLPVISLFLGGKASVAVSRVRGVGPAALQGALIAIPFTILMVMLSLISTITYNYISTSTSTSSTASNTLSSAGAGAADIILWALLSGAVFGLLGGIYEASSLKTSGRKLLSNIGRALSLPARPVYLLFDKLSRQSPSSRTRARSLLYGAFVVALLLVIVALIVGGSLIAMNQTVTFQDNLRARDVVSMLLVVLPGLLLLSACVSVLSAAPDEAR
jgi:hypothetical protein